MSDWAKNFIDAVKSLTEVPPRVVQCGDRASIMLRGGARLSLFRDFDVKGDEYILAQVILENDSAMPICEVKRGSELFSYVRANVKK